MSQDNGLGGGMDVRPGDFGLVRIVGGVGRMIRVGQWLLGDGFADFEHAFVYVGDGRIVEAQPGGARETGLADYEGRPIVWSTGKVPVTGEQRAAIVAAAYSYLGVRVPLVRRFVADAGHMICSQLVDQCYQDAGVHLFADRRWPGDVTPGDLYRLIR
jgi:uncharacterized protein YycO